MNTVNLDKIPAWRWRWVKSGATNRRLNKRRSTLSRHGKYMKAYYLKGR